MRFWCFKIFLIFILLSTSSSEPNLNILTYPVGHGDAFLLECYDEGTSKISITLIDGGSVSIGKGEILTEYIRFITNKLRDPKFRLENIILTIPNEGHYGFIRHILDLIRDEETAKIKFYIGGSRNSYVDLELATKYDSNVFEFTRMNEDGGSLSSCGHYPWGDTKRNFFNCVKRNSKGPIPGSNGIINICKSYQISVLAANFGLSHEFSGQINSTDSKYKNSLILKVTPSGKADPSMLVMGAFENEDMSMRDKSSGDAYYNYIKGTHWHYVSRPTTPIQISHGLKSTLLVLPQHGADTNFNIDQHFFGDYVKPTYAIVSSDVHNTYGNPKCKVVKALNLYMRQFAVREKELQCHVTDESEIEEGRNHTTGQKRQHLSKDMIHSILCAENIFQTTTIDAKNAALQFNLISFSMNKETVIPTSFLNIFNKIL